MDVLVVVPVDPMGADFFDRTIMDRFVDAKSRTLGYIEASINTPIGPRRLMSSRAPLGAVASEEDASRLIAALATEFPGVNFRVETRQYPDAQDIVWHQVR